MKKIQWFSLFLVCCLLLCGMALAQETTFAYEHDPRENPNAMKDIVENPFAVYGFSPNPDSVRLGEYADLIDWTNPEQVAAARAQRQAYHDSMSELYRMIEDMLLETKPVEEIARAVSRRRNELRIEASQNDPVELERLKKSNLATYGNEEGPTPDQLFEKYGSWQTVLEKALGTNAGMDACLGFYDEYFEMYDLEEPVQAAQEAVTPAQEAEAPAQEAEAPVEAENAYTLDKVVVLSRHNIRSPMSGSGSVLAEITPHEWFQWTSKPSELSLRGAVLETMMGQYFRLWLEKEGFFPENYRPEEGAVRFYANAKQRTLATARYFSAGLLPVAAVPIESHAEYDTMDPTFEPSIHFATEAYVEDVLEGLSAQGGEQGLNGLFADLDKAVALLRDTAEVEKSEAYQSGKYGDLLTGETTLTLVQGKEPRLKGPVGTAVSVADAMTLQYYEEADERKAAFGHDLSQEDWRLIHSIVDRYTDVLFGYPLVSVNAANPLLREIRSELSAEGRRFTFLCGHDSNVASVLAALNCEDYLLPEAVEQRTPIGVKLVFGRWLNEQGEAFWQIHLVYQSTRQLREMTPLTLENPPMVYPLRFADVPLNADGMATEEDVLAMLDRAIEAYEELQEKYGEEEELDQAA